MYSRVLNNLPKTNNSIKGWQHRFETEVGAHHPNVWRFIKCLQIEQSFNEAQIELYVAGKEPEPPRKRHADVAKRIKRLIEAFDPNDIVEYIRGIPTFCHFSRFYVLNKPLFFSLIYVGYFVNLFFLTHNILSVFRPIAF